MKLFDRDEHLNQLNIALHSAENDNGKLIVISGEAGVGKTALVEKFIEDKDIKIYWGACDALQNPRPLGPLYDIAMQSTSNLLHLLEKNADRHLLFSHAQKLFCDKSQPVLMIIEDIHWADESTIDLIKFLAKRINKEKALLIVTFRDDEGGSNHPVKTMFGDIPQKNILRMTLTPLSEKSVEDIAKLNKVSIPGLYKKTNGNPLFVTELASAKDENIPLTIKDTILAKLSRFTENAKRFIELISVIPGKIENDFIRELIDDYGILEECLESGIIKNESQHIFFKHDLVRLAIEDSLSQLKKEQLNSQLLDLLLKKEDKDKSLANIVHHAANANNVKAIIKYAPLAAKQASKLGAHKQAAKHYLIALQYSSQLSVEEHLTMLEGRSYECYLTGEIADGIKAGETIIKILENYPDPERAGENYRRLSRMYWYDCNDEKGEEYLDKAIEILEKLAPGKQLAMAYSNKSQTYMLREKTGLAIIWGKKAVELSKQISDKDIETHALNNIGTAKMLAGDNSGEDDLKESLELSLRNNFFEQAARAYINFGSVKLQQKSLADADMYYTQGSEYTYENDLYTYGLCLAGHHSKVKLSMGNWEEAIRIAKTMYRNENIPVANRIMPLCVLGMVAARKNDPEAFSLLDEANILALTVGEIEKIVAVKGARAEAFWLQNKLEDNIKEIEDAFNIVKNGDNAWATGELAFWLWRAGQLTKIPKRIADPYLFHIKGDWKSAAELWEKLQCPYEQALALSDGNKEAMKNALEIFDRLGAFAASQFIKQKMRESGIRNIPKGPRKTTKENPAGLTTRQLEVLDLVGKGLSNNEIGNKLYISSKTVDHHVSAIFSKLKIHSRSEAANIIHSKNFLNKK